MPNWRFLCPKNTGMLKKSIKFVFDKMNHSIFASLLAVWKEGPAIVGCVFILLKVILNLFENSGCWITSSCEEPFTPKNHP